MYRIIRNREGWVQGNEGDVLIMDKEKNTTLWVPNNIITFNDRNQPVLRNSVCSELDQAEEITLECEYEDTITHDQDEEVTVERETFSATSERLTNEPHIEDANEVRQTWSYNHTKALITAVEARYEEMFHINKKKDFWSTISTELTSQNIEYSEIACKKKWANLVRTYKVVKDHKAKTGRGPTRFMFFEQLDVLLGDAPTNASPHTVDVARINIVDGPSTSGTSSNVSQKRKNPTTEYVQFKKKYYEGKEMRAVKRQETQQNYQNQQLKLLDERNVVLREKNEIEKKKLELLEKLFIHTNVNH